MNRIHKTKFLITGFFTIGLAMSGLMVFYPQPQIHAQTANDVCKGVEFTGGGTCPPNAAADRSTLSTVATNFLNIFSAIVGIASVAMIIFSGFRYITAGGDASKISTAQQTIIYAIVGLVIAGFAQVIVRFVIASASA